MSATGDVDKRQIWRPDPSSKTTSIRPRCTPFTLPSAGTIALGPSSTITISADAVFQPPCSGHGALDSSVPLDPSSVADLRDPFYASTIPQAYAISAATVLSYMLVIMLFITPRTFLFRNGTGGRRLLGGRGILAGARGTTSVIGVGGRPWLQKVAALTVAISLTIASADTFKVAKQQYETGYMDANEMRDEVVGSVEIEVVRVISDTFLWLAQVQTLIRLFPRHKEKVIIKWAGFALIMLDTIFSTLNNFVYPGTSRPRSYVDAIPALSYLFQLALSLLYASWVIYYSITKRRYAFYHPRMRNISLVAILALSSILVPVIFFVLDISNPTLAGWGDYVRWVGAAAASVVVWEWVERVEALERDERKDGVLGREIFDGDEMLDVTPSAEVNWPLNQWRGPGPNSIIRGDGRPPPPSFPPMATTRENLPPMNGAVRFRPQTHPRQRPALGHLNNEGPEARASLAMPHSVLNRTVQQHPGSHPSPPPMSTTPVSRADTTSAASTVYAVHYHPPGDSPAPNFEVSPIAEHPGHGSNDYTESPSTATHEPAEESVPQWNQRENSSDVRRSLSISNETHNFDSGVTLQPERDQAQSSNVPQITDAQQTRKSGLRLKLSHIAGSSSLGLFNRGRKLHGQDPLPVRVIPAQPRNRDASPWILTTDDTPRGSIIQRPPDVETTMNDETHFADEHEDSRFEDQAQTRREPDMRPPEEHNSTHQS